jgi:hypothetical protein
MANPFLVGSDTGSWDYVDAVVHHSDDSSPAASLSSSASAEGLSDIETSSDDGEDDEEQAAESQRQIKVLQKEITGLKQMCAKYEQDLQQSQKHVMQNDLLVQKEGTAAETAIHHEVDRLTQAMEALRADSEKYREAVLAEEDRYNKLLEEARSMRSSWNITEQSLRDKIAAYDALLIEHTTKVKECVYLQKDNTSLQEQLVDLKEKLAGNRARNKTQTEASELQKSQIGVLQEAQRALERRIGSMQKAEAKTQTDLANANALVQVANSALQEALAAKAGPAIANTVALQQKVVECQKLEEELRQTSTKLAEALTMQARLKYAFGESLQKYKDLQGDHAAELQKQKQAFTSLVLSKSKEIDALQKKLAALVAIAAEVQPLPA